MAYAVRVSHSISGRVRLKAVGPHRHRAGRELAARFKTLPGVREVQPNHLTGSLLLHLDPRVYSNAGELLMAALEAGIDLTEIPAEEDVAGANYDQPSLAARAIADLLKSVDRSVVNATSNALDLRSALPLAATIIAVRLSRRHWQATPLWLTLMLFSVTAAQNLQQRVASQADTPLVLHNGAPAGNPPS